MLTKCVLWKTCLNLKHFSSQINIAHLHFSMNFLKFPLWNVGVILPSCRKMAGFNLLKQAPTLPICTAFGVGDTEMTSRGVSGFINITRHSLRRPPVTSGSWFVLAFIWFKKESFPNQLSDEVLLNFSSCSHRKKKKKSSCKNLDKECI